MGEHLKESGFDIHSYREDADKRAAEINRAPVSPAKTDGPDISDVVTKAIAGLSDRKVQFTYADMLARTVSQLEAKPGVFELARTGIDAAIEREQLIPLDREKGLFTSNIHVLDELFVKALSQRFSARIMSPSRQMPLLCVMHLSAMRSACWRRTGRRWGLFTDRRGHGAAGAGG